MPAAPSGWPGVPEPGGCGAAVPVRRQVHRDAAHQAVPRGGPAVRRREDCGRARAAVCHPQARCAVILVINIFLVLTVHFCTAPPLLWVVIVALGTTHARRFQPSPFFVLDEIDAALDAVNVARIAKYIRDCTRDGAANGFQSIVISLKVGTVSLSAGSLLVHLPDEGELARSICAAVNVLHCNNSLAGDVQDIFFEKADLLIGVARDPDHGASATLTFDLNSYGEP